MKTLIFAALLPVSLMSGAGTITVIGNDGSVNRYNTYVDPGLINNPNGIIQEHNITVYDYNTKPETKQDNE